MPVYNSKQFSKSGALVLSGPYKKKPQYNGDLTSTRPITLIDHTRKILTKILTERLSNILLKLDILAPQNNVAFPFSSTMIPIQQLDHIMGKCPYIQPRILDLTPGYVKSLRYHTHSLTMTRPQPPPYFFSIN